MKLRVFSCLKVEFYKWKKLITGFRSASQHLNFLCVKISLVVEGDRDKKRMVVDRESEFQVIEGC